LLCFASAKVGFEMACFASAKVGFEMACFASAKVGFEMACCALLWLRSALKWLAVLCFG
jgi:hypothetical protein